MSGGRHHFLPLGFSDDVCRAEIICFTMKSSCWAACSWSLKVSVSTRVAALMEGGMERDKASALLFKQPLRYLMVKLYSCSEVKGFRPHGLLVYRLYLPPDTPIIFIYLVLVPTCTRGLPSSEIITIARDSSLLITERVCQGGSDETVLLQIQQPNILSGWHYSIVQHYLGPYLHKQWLTILLKHSSQANRTCISL